MSKARPPVTPAVRALRAAGVAAKHSGYLVGLAPDDVRRLLAPRLVRVGI